MRDKLLKKIFLKESVINNDNLKELELVLNNSSEEFLDKIHDIIKKKIKKDKHDVIKENITEKKDKIIEIIKNIENEKELDSILSYINRKFILESIRTFVLNKIGSLGNRIDILISDFIINADTDFKSKIDFVVFLNEKGHLFKGEEILNKKNGNFYSLINLENSTYIKIRKQIANLDGSLGFKQIQGAGELFLVLFGKDINFSDHSDINIAGLDVEVKTSRKSASGSTSGGRFSGTSHYTNMSSIKPLFLKDLLRAGVDEKDLKDNENNLNLNYKGIENLNKLIKKYSIKYDDVYNIFLNIFNNIMIKFNDDNIKPYLNKFIKNDGTIDANEFIKTATLISFEYYKFIEGFDMVLLMNTDSGNFVIIEKPEDLIKYSDILRFSSPPSWSEGRKPSISPQIILK